MKKSVFFYPKTSAEPRSRIPYAALYWERYHRYRFPDAERVIIDEHVIPEEAWNPWLWNNIATIDNVNVSAMTGYQLYGAMKFSHAVRLLAWNTPVTWGGWHVTLTQPKMFINPYRYLYDNFHIGALPPCEGYLNFDLLPIQKYVRPNAYAKRCLGYFTSHGCPYSCGFCCVNKIWTHWEAKTLTEIERDIKELKRLGNIDSITFDDDNFFVNKEHVKAVCEIMKREGLLWDAGAHVGALLKMFGNDMQYLYNHGCRQLYIGAETGDADALAHIGKRATVEDTVEFVRLCKDAGILPLLSLMVAFPNNPDKDIAATKEMLCRCKEEVPGLRARVFFYTPYPGTAMYKEAIKAGFEPPGCMEGWADHTLRRFRAPWWTRDYRRELEDFMCFYFPLSDLHFWSLAPGLVMLAVLPFNYLFWPIARARLAFRWYRYPIEARLFLWGLSLFNKITGRKLSLGYESYYD